MAAVKSVAALGRATTTTQAPSLLLDLPKELRDQIWKLCIPRDRMLRVKFDFQNTQARVVGPFSRIPTILQICQDSRRFALHLLQRGFETMPPKDFPTSNNFYWCPEFDRLYILNVAWDPNYNFRSDDSDLEQESLNDYWALKQAAPKVRHLAFPLTHVLISGFHSNAPLAGQARWLTKVLQESPVVKTVYLVTTPFYDWLGESRDQGVYGAHSTSLPTVVVAYEPLDENIYSLDNKPSSIEQTIEESLETLCQDEEGNAHDWEPPSFQVMVLGKKRFRNSGFCIPSQKNLGRWVV